MTKRDADFCIKIVIFGSAKSFHLIVNNADMQ